MKYQTKEHRNANALLGTEGLSQEWDEIKQAITGIEDNKIIKTHKERCKNNKSISRAINILLKESLIEKGWDPESRIFSDESYNEKNFRLDFAKKSISIEVAFNHGEAIAWNLIKPVLASELNHVKKQAQTKMGIMITATESLKKHGGFDNAVGTFEKTIRYLKPMQAQLSCPILIIGLERPETFNVEHYGSPKKAKFVSR